MYVGMDRFDVREQIEKYLQAAGLLEKVEPYTNNVGCSERTNVPIEPKLSMQWFLKMEHLAEIALSPVMNDDIRFFPSKFKNTYRHWMENIKDWCISRQLWWGHRIPAWYLPEGGYVVAYNEEEALRLAREKSHNSNLTIADLRQDEDLSLIHIYCGRILIDKYICDYDGSMQKADLESAMEAQKKKGRRIKKAEE